MSMKKYSEYLPSYLDGENIRRHAEIIEDMDNRVYSQMRMIERWADIDRPILVERVATANVVMYNIHIQCTTFIRSIHINGDYTLREEYLEDEGIEETVIRFSMPNNSLVDMAKFIVEVVDYDDITYRKGYPENDTVLGDVYDHDTALDNIGLLLNLPRKRYISYPLTDAEKSYPPFYGKEVENNVVQPCTEDDYYYVQRLKQLKEHMHDKNMGAVLLDLMYGYKSIVVLDSTVLENQQLIEYITDQYPDFEENIQPGVYVFFIPEENPVNYESITMNNKQDFIDKYIPVTRCAVLADTIHTSLSISDDTELVRVIPGSWPDSVYWHDYSFEVLTDDDERPTVESSLTYTLDQQDPVTIPYVLDDSTEYRDKTLLSPGVHRVTVEYPASLGYEHCSAGYVFKYLLDAWKTIPANTAYNYYCPRSTNGVGNMIRATSSGFEYTQTDNTHPETSDYDRFTAVILPAVTRDNMVVLEYDVNGYGDTPYTFGVYPNGQGYSQTNNPSRVIAEELSGMHRVSIQLPSGKLYVDGHLAGLNKPLAEGYMYNGLFLQILRKSGKVYISESRVSHYTPYYLDGGVYQCDEFVGWQEYTVRAIVDLTSSTSNVGVFFGIDETGLTATLPTLTSGRHTISLMVVNNKGYLYVDDTLQSSMYDYTDCKQYTINTGTGEITSTTRTDNTVLFNNVCNFSITPTDNLTVKTVGIAPTTLREEIETHTPVEDITISYTTDITDIPSLMVNDYNVHFHVECRNNDGELVTGIPVTVTIAGTPHTVTGDTEDITIPLSSSDVRDNRISFTVSVPPGRYYRGASTSGEIAVNSGLPFIFLDYVEPTAGEQCTLRAHCMNADGTPITTQTKCVFKYYHKSIKVGNVVQYVYPDSNGVCTLSFTPPTSDSGKTRTLSAVLLNSPYGRLESNERIFQVGTPTNNE